MLTEASSKIGAYPFTTLEPHLGTFFGYVLADIPGLIEGASEGKGLGHKFLRHVRRTKMLVHLVSLENEDLVKTYDAVRSELKNFDANILQKDEIVLLTKSDLVSEEILKEKIVSEKDRGKLLLITSHILSDLDELSTEVIYIIDGKVQYDNSIELLKEETGEKRLSKAIVNMIKQKKLLESIADG